MKLSISTLALCAALAMPAFAQKLPVTVRSPDERVVLHVVQDEGGGLIFSIERSGETLIAPSPLKLMLAEGDVTNVEVLQTNPRRIQQVHKLVATKASEAKDNFNEITLVVTPRSHAIRTLNWIFRVYDDGVAFRFRVPADAGVQTLAVRREDTELTFGGDYDCHGFNVGRVDSSHEGEFDPVKASHIRAHNLYDVPLVCRTGKNVFAIGEADLAG